MDRSRADIAEELFRGGANCSQAIAGAFSDLVDIDREVLMRMVSPFGGGLARLREVCGAVSAGALVLGYLNGISEKHTHDEKAELYKYVGGFAEEFAAVNGSYICAEILNARKDGFVPEERSAEYYDKRPCIGCIRSAAVILESMIKKEDRA